ncbi:uncharacterized protein LOC112183578 [Rosa chinensis]|uniref:uncharacterized protein LOC112183578 n=1 Tax=Rosa chinensis TaxID=74649 RepID=UPI001AD8B12D|nr:uncharacterized protein LOC112183578 [Rosa chinensis]
MGSWVMWPKKLIIFDEKKKTSGKASRKQKRNHFAEDVEEEFDLQSLESSLPAALQKLYEWGKEGFKDRKAVCFYKEEPVFGINAKSYLLGLDVKRLANMAEVTGTIIVLYMRYLYDVLKKSKMVDMVGFVDPALTGEIGCGSATTRSRSIKDRLISASPNQIFLVPYNASAHWVLTVIDPDNDTVYFMDPLKKRLGGNGEWKDIVDT